MKRLLVLFAILFMPIGVFAYSDYLYLGGKSLGIEVETDGVMIIGFYKIDGKYNKGKPELRVGDYILKINDEKVNDAEDIANVILNADDKRSINIEFKRNNEVKKAKLNLVQSDGKYKTGLYVKASIKGIGTLTYIDPDTKIFGALGHEITQGEENILVEIKEGIIFESNITGISKSTPGVIGSKEANFNYNNVYGNIEKNTRYGIFGKYDKEINKDNLIKVSRNIKIGKAYIKTVLSNDEEKEYEIEITSINENSNTKNITYRITDESLYKKTGGIVQGMSGSPIIQDGNLVGCVTHVIVDNPITGYGILITKMLEEGEK